MSLAKTLSDKTLARLVERFGLEEVHGADGGPWRTLGSAMTPDPVGHVRIMHGGPVYKLVTISLTVDMIGLDSHMIFAFTSPDSAIPHFTLDSVKAPAGPPGAPAGPEQYAFHLDLIPRVDLGANLAYSDAVFGPLEEAVLGVRKAEGTEPAHLSIRQLSIMSPWMLAMRVEPEAFESIVFPVVDKTLDHWFALAGEGLPAAVEADLTTVDLAHRDRVNRTHIFDPEVDAVWAQVTRLIGEESSEEARLVLMNQELPDA
ncbi:MAG: hypothetical protein ACI867_000782 [Glaciecola sp.]|jgi:hypothetical protein